MKGKDRFLSAGSPTERTALCVQAFVWPMEKLTAHKFWMMFDDGFVLPLGAGINCDSDHPIVTSINQCLLHGDASKSDESVTHDGFTRTPCRDRNSR